jgi:hypothetical protein
VDLDGFRATVAAGELPAGVGPCLRALWTEARGDWKGGHEIVQEENGADAAWVHAYLHRKEGDIGNAQYWYRRAGRPASSASHDDEWAEIVQDLLRRR